MLRDYSKLPKYRRTLRIRTANYPDCLGPSGKLVDNSTKLIYLEITGYRIKFSTAFWSKGVEASFFCSFLARQPPAGQVLLVQEVTRSHSDAPRSVRLLCTSDQLVA